MADPKWTPKMPELGARGALVPVLGLSPHGRWQRGSQAGVCMPVPCPAAPLFPRPCVVVSRRRVLFAND